MICTYCQGAQEIERFESDASSCVVILSACPGCLGTGRERAARELPKTDTADAMKSARKAVSAFLKREKRKTNEPSQPVQKGDTPKSQT